MADRICPALSEMQPPPLPQVPEKRRYTTNKDWEKYRTMLEGPWQGLEIKEIVRLLKEEGFSVTEKQVKDRLSTKGRGWGLGRNVKKSEMKAIVRKQQQKKAAGKGCRIRVRGQTVDQEKISRWQKRTNGGDLLLEEEATVSSPAATTPSDVSCSTVTPSASPYSDPVDVDSFQEFGHDIKVGVPFSTAITQEHNYQLHSTSETESATSEFEKFLLDDHTTFEVHSPAPFTAPSTPAPEPSALDHTTMPQIFGPKMDAIHSQSSESQNLSSWLYTYNNSNTLAERMLPDPAAEESWQHNSSHTTILRSKKYMRFRQKDEDDLFKRYKDFELRYGANHPAILDTGRRLGEVYTAQGRYRIAEALLKQMARACLLTFGENDVRTLQAFNSLVGVFLGRGRVRLAESLSRQIYTKAQSCLAVTNPVLLRFGNSLAGCLHNSGSNQEAEALYRKTVRIGGGSLAPDEAPLMEAMYRLSLMLNEKGELIESEKILRGIIQSLELSTRPEENMNLLRAQGALGEVLLKKCDPEAEVMLRKVHQDQIRILGPEHRVTLWAQNVLALSIQKAGAFQEAISLLRDAVEKSSRTIGAKHPDTLSFWLGLASVFIEIKRCDEAKEIASKVSLISTSELGSDHATAYESFLILGRCYAGLGDLEKAAAELDRTLVGLQRTYGPAYYMTKSCLMFRDGVYRDLEQMAALQRQA